MKKIILAFIITSFISSYINQMQAQVTFFVSNVPSSTPPQDDIFVSGNFENWTGGSELYKLKKENGKYAITLPQQTGTLLYKFTRGSWASVEKSANGSEIPNRSYTFGGNGDTVKINIANWADVSSNSTAAPNVTILSNNFPMPQFGDRKRKIWIYLPPGYDDNTASYPVLYMHDGQNLFDQYTSFAGEWKVDETMNELSASKNLNLIVVGIDNGGSLRIEEYTPWENKTYGGGDAEKYTEFIVKTLKPYIDSAFHTKPEKKFTGIMGSSLGGLVSHFAALQYPDIFGKAGVFSPSFWFSDTCYQFAKDHANIQGQKMYFLAGDSESGGMVPDLEKMIKSMKETGYDSVGIQKKIVPGGKHNEQLWSNGFGEAVTWLFSDVTSTSAKNLSELKQGFMVFPNPAGKSLQIKTEYPFNYQLRIIDLQGKIAIQRDTIGNTAVDISSLPGGSYFIECTGQNLRFVDKFLKD